MTTTNISLYSGKGLDFLVNYNLDKKQQTFSNIFELINEEAEIIVNDMELDEYMRKIQATVTDENGDEVGEVNTIIDLNDDLLKCVENVFKKLNDLYA